MISIKNRWSWSKFGFIKIKDEYKEENEERNLLGTLIVFALAQGDYILQLDYKEDLEDYIHIIKDFWKDTETKLIEFDLGDDQHYYAWVLENANLDNMYEVSIQNVNVNGIKNLEITSFGLFFSLLLNQCYKKILGE